MTVMRQTNVAGPFRGNGLTTEWEYKFRVDELEDFYVYLRDWNTKIDVLIPPSEYSVTGIGSGSEEGGTVTYPLFGEPIGPDYAIVIEREVKYIQQASISNNGGFYPKVVEQAFDNLQFQIQQLAEKVARAPATPVGEIPLTIVPEPFDRLMFVGPDGFMRSSETTKDERSQRIAGDNALGGRIDRLLSDVDEIADRAEHEADRSAAFADSSQQFMKESQEHAEISHQLVEAAVAGFQGFTDGMAYDFGWIADPMTYFNRDWGTI